MHPNHRQRGITRTLLHSVHAQAETWLCKRIYLTSEQEDQVAQSTWTRGRLCQCPRRPRDQRRFGLHRLQRARS
ncbi:GNAT family N-acetyltransferase [Nocardia sp. NPDC051911]|uniref:GNAT family N-acetyltransferase n=1 Tax=Nocardia sp. NPDC051911 TaxID=3154648 RepID=UPI003412C785